MAMAARRRFAAFFDPATPPSSDADTDEETPEEAAGGGAAAAAVAAAMTAADAVAVLAAPLVAAGEPPPPAPADLGTLPAASVAAALAVDAPWPPREASVWGAVRRWAAAAAGVADDASAAEAALWSPAQRGAVAAHLRPLLSPDGGGSGCGGCVRLLDLPPAVMAAVERLGDPDPAELLAYYRYHALVAEEAAARRRRGCGGHGHGRGGWAAAAAAATVAVVDRYYGRPSVVGRPFDCASLRRRLRAAVVAVESAHPLPAGMVVGHAAEDNDNDDDDDDDGAGATLAAATADGLPLLADAAALPPGARRLRLPPWASTVRLVVDPRTALPPGVALRFYCGPAVGADAGGRLPPGWVGTRILRSPVLGYRLVAMRGGSSGRGGGGEHRRPWGYAFTLEPLFREG